MSLYDYSGTVDAFQSIKDNKIEFKLLNLLKSGKEAQVYLVDYRGELAALKLFKNHEQRSFKNTATYFSGRYIKSRTLRQAVRKRTKLGLDYIQNEWIAREYSLLRKFHSLGFYVPEPYATAGSGVLMEFLGDENGPAPLIKNVHLSEDEAQEALDELFGMMMGFFYQGFVHGDLSEYNILWWRNKPYVIDFPQAVETRSNSHAKDMMIRDLECLLTFFSKSIPNLNSAPYYKAVYDELQFI